MRLRDYQQEIYNDVAAATSHDLVQLDTGAGKTAIEAALFQSSEYAMLVAHRNVLITQCSATVARFGIHHDTVSSEFTRRRCMQAHKDAGRNFIRRGHRHKLVVSIDSLISHYRHNRLALERDKPWLIIIDEAHHVVPDNKWGQLTEIFPHARFIGFTATPGRMDGASLSVRNGGLFERLVQCSWLRENSTEKLINAGMLCGFSAWSPGGDLVNSAKSGKLYVSTSAVDAYKKYMPGLQCIVMCPAIKNAREIAREFIDAGISAGSISSDMSGSEVWRVLREFSAGRISVLCNVEMIAEGFDVPDVAGLIICRFTKSFIMYRQMIGRVLRPGRNKQRAVIVDLAGVIAEHGDPDESVIWDIDNPPKTPNTLRCHPCDNCGFWFPARDRHCPECGEQNTLLYGKSVSSRYVELERLDMHMINIARREIAAEQIEKNKCEEIYISTSVFNGTGAIGQVIVKLRHKFAESLLSCGIPVREINRVLNECSVTDNPDFWIKNFKASHVNNMPENIAMRAYKKCQK